MLNLKKQNINLKIILSAGSLLVSYLAIFLIPHLRNFFNDRELPFFTKEIIVYFLLISTLQIICYYLFFKFLPRDYFKKYFKIFLVLSFVAATIFLALPLQGSADLFNYIFYTKILTDYGENPYLHPIKKFSDDPFFSFTNRGWRGREVTPYGPAWTLFSQIPYKFSGFQLSQKIFGFKLFNFIFWLAVGYLIFLILKKTKPNLSHLGTIFYFLNPFILFEVVNNGHNDIVFIFFVLSAFYFYLNNKKLLVLPLLTVSFLIKYASLIILPFFLLILIRDKNKKIFSLLISLILSLIIVFLVLWPFSFNWTAMMGNLSHQASVPPTVYFFSAGPLIFLIISSLLIKQPLWGIKFLSFGLFILSYIYLLIKSLKKENIITFSFWSLFLYLLVATFWLQPWYFIWLIPLAILKMDNPLFYFLVLALSLLGFWSYSVPLGLVLFLLIGVISILKISKINEIFLKYD